MDPLQDQSPEELPCSKYLLFSAVFTAHKTCSLLGDDVLHNISASHYKEFLSVVQQGKINSWWQKCYPYNLWALSWCYISTFSGESIPVPCPGGRLNAPCSAQGHAEWEWSQALCFPATFCAHRELSFGPAHPGTIGCQRKVHEGVGSAVMTQPDKSTPKSKIRLQNPQTSQQQSKTGVRHQERDKWY